MNRSRWIRLLAAAGVGVLVAAASAWACVPQPLVSVQPMASGPAGAQVSVTGIALAAGKVEVRWNASDGPLLATGDGPQISREVTIPQAAPGLYTIMVLERTATGALGSTGRAAFLVTGDAGAGGPPTTTAPGASPRASGSSSSGPALAAGGGGLLVGGLAGGLVARRGRQPGREERD